MSQQDLAVALAQLQSLTRIVSAQSAAIDAGDEAKAAARARDALSLRAAILRRIGIVDERDVVANGNVPQNGVALLTSLHSLVEERLSAARATAAPLSPLAERLTRQREALTARRLERERDLKDGTLENNASSAYFTNSVNGESLVPPSPQGNRQSSRYAVMYAFDVDDDNQSYIYSADMDDDAESPTYSGGVELTYRVAAMAAKTPRMVGEPRNGAVGTPVEAGARACVDFIRSREASTLSRLPRRAVSAAAALLRGRTQSSQPRGSRLLRIPLPTSRDTVNGHASRCIAGGSQSSSPRSAAYLELVTTAKQLSGSAVFEGRVSAAAPRLSGAPIAHTNSASLHAVSSAGSRCGGPRRVGHHASSVISGQLGRRRSIQPLHVPPVDSAAAAAEAERVALARARAQARAASFVVERAMQQAADAKIAAERDAARWAARDARIANFLSRQRVAAVLVQQQLQHSDIRESKPSLSSSVHSVEARPVAELRLSKPEADGQQPLQLQRHISQSQHTGTAAAAERDVFPSMPTTGAVSRSSLGDNKMATTQVPSGTGRSSLMLLKRRNSRMTKAPADMQAAASVPDSAMECAPSHAATIVQQHGTVPLDSQQHSDVQRQRQLPERPHHCLVDPDVFLHDLSLLLGDPSVRPKEAVNHAEFPVGRSHRSSILSSLGAASEERHTEHVVAGGALRTDFDPPQRRVRPGIATAAAAVAAVLGAAVRPRTHSGAHVVGGTSHVGPGAVTADDDASNTIQTDSRPHAVTPRHHRSTSHSPPGSLPSRSLLVDDTSLDVTAALRVRLGNGQLTAGRLADNDTGYATSPALPAKQLPRHNTNSSTHSSGAAPTLSVEMGIYDALPANVQTSTNVHAVETDARGVTAGATSAAQHSVFINTASPGALDGAVPLLSGVIHSPGPTPPDVHNSVTSVSNDDAGDCGPDTTTRERCETLSPPVDLLAEVTRAGDTTFDGLPPATAAMEVQHAVTPSIQAAKIAVVSDQAPASDALSLLSQSTSHARPVGAFTPTRSHKQRTRAGAALAATAASLALLYSLQERGGAMNEGRRSKGSASLIKSMSSADDTSRTYTSVHSSAGLDLTMKVSTKRHTPPASPRQPLGRLLQ